MSKGPLALRRLPVRLTSDPRHTITRFFWLGAERARKIIARVMRLDDAQTRQLLIATMHDFNHLRTELNGVFRNHYEEAARRVIVPASLSPEKKQLIGAHFTLEYSFASAALFNPSITPAVHQDGVPAGSLRFAMSLRAVGEGHVSSVVFRRGIVDAAGSIALEPAGPYREPRRTVESRQLSKREFRNILARLRVHDKARRLIMERLGDPFTTEDLRGVLYGIQASPEGPLLGEDTRRIEWLGGCDYDIDMGPTAAISEIVLFPMGEVESQGMEDMRLVRFTEDDGSYRYYGTYTAYNGRQTRLQLLDMPTPSVAHIRSLQGRFALNKGLALFPRKVQGRYLMSGRIDGENLYLLRSDNIRVWDEAVMVQEPRFTWEHVQVGNCGSPIETEAGWLLLTHGVGPMRRYCIGASLFDRDDPTKLLGRLEEPLIAPIDEERHGYVPNVVYSCGSLVHNGLLLIPYGISDAATGFATVALDDLLACLR